MKPATHSAANLALFGFIPATEVCTDYSQKPTSEKVADIAFVSSCSAQNLIPRNTTFHLEWNIFKKLSRTKLHLYKADSMNRTYFTFISK